jgi:ferredoxin
MSKIKIVVDWELCVGHGQCEFVAPDVFTINDAGKLELKEYPDESERANVQQAVRRCPTHALSIQEVATGHD